MLHNAIFLMKSTENTKS